MELDPHGAFFHSRFGIVRHDVLAVEPNEPAGNPPSVELLEFLGGFETPEGEWFDPLLLVEQTRGQAEPKVTGDD